jgi:riboflavin-specific deaminase-like protein
MEEKVLFPLSPLVTETRQFCQRTGRPLVTLSYAQSLDGSIALYRGSAIALSGSESQKLTHELRAAHDAILIGIGTVLSDDPRLTVRLIQGPSPLPVVLDSQLRLPLNAKLLKNNVAPCIATTIYASQERQSQLEERGGEVIRLAADDRGWVDLKSLLTELARRDITSILVEGGARVITNFLSQRLVDRIVITITPRLLGGLKALENPLNKFAADSLDFGDFGYQQAGQDMIFWGKLTWQERDSSSSGSSIGVCSGEVCIPYQ